VDKVSYYPRFLWPLIHGRFASLACGSWWKHPLRD